MCYTVNPLWPSCILNGSLLEETFAPPGMRSPVTLSLSSLAFLHLCQPLSWWLRAACVCHPQLWWTRVEQPVQEVTSLKSVPLSEVSLPTGPPPSPSLSLGQPDFAEGFLPNSSPPKPEATEVPKDLRVKKKKSLVPESRRPVSPVLKSFANSLALFLV